MSHPGDDPSPPQWWPVKRRLVQDPIALAAPLHTDLGDRPHNQSILQPRGIDSSQKLLGVTVAVVMGLFVAVAVAEQLWSLALIGAVLAGLAGVAAWVAWLRATMSWSATWHRDHVVVCDGRYGPVRTWWEPLSAFTGVTRRCAYVSRGNELTAGQQVHGVLLEHPHTHKSLLLHAQREPIGDELLAAYARDLRTREIT